MLTLRGRICANRIDSDASTFRTLMPVTVDVTHLAPQVAMPAVVNVT
ncbi:hypothetical protein CryarDRAFT_0334 [Cryptosporangium arvum DSM 44712]|uniref:Uncharacterized protein n=1 Tax=Cryptosporangium arvum DSM 44712 TaxID=927661 RepID=A0A011ABC9_9ACTN|nr:hypothetical protein CryarDRAFT_0334 [Cryptosporangium arvum DSM 44712]